MTEWIVKSHPERFTSLEACVSILRGDKTRYMLVLHFPWRIYLHSKRLGFRILSITFLRKLSWEGRKLCISPSYEYPGLYFLSSSPVILMPYMYDDTYLSPYFHRSKNWDTRELHIYYFCK